MSGGLHCPLIINPSRLLTRGLGAFGDVGPWPGGAWTWIATGGFCGRADCGCSMPLVPARTLSLSFSPARDRADSETRGTMDEELPVRSPFMSFAVCFRKGSLSSSAAVGRCLASVVMQRSMNAFTSGFVTSSSPLGGSPCVSGHDVVKKGKNGGGKGRRRA